MISDETIKTLATKFQTTELNVEREYFQHLFLSYLSQQPASEHVFFKGGTALRIFYNSPRFSEDLDFNSADISYTGIESLVLATLSQMEKENSKFTLKEGNPTSGGFFAIVAFEAFARSISIQIEISQREEEKRGEVIAITSDFVPPYNLFAVTEKQLVFEKIRALLQRKKPRDFYDLYFILRKELPIPDKKGCCGRHMPHYKLPTSILKQNSSNFFPKHTGQLSGTFRQVSRENLSDTLDNVR